MKCRLIDLSISIQGKQRLTLELDGDFRKTWDELHEKDCEVSIKKFRNRRSNEANAYAWVLIDKISQKMRLTKTEVYRNAIRDVGGTSDMITIKKAAVDRLQKQWSANGLGWQVEDIGSKIPGWTNLILYYGSSVYDSKQMSDFIEKLVSDARSLGIETRPDEEIQSMIKEYFNAEQSRRPRKIHS